MRHGNEFLLPHPCRFRFRDDYAPGSDSRRKFPADRRFRHRGHRTVLFRKIPARLFGITHCQTVCPPASARIDRALDELGNRVQALDVTVYPERDTPEALRAFLAARRVGEPDGRRPGEPARQARLRRRLPEPGPGERRPVLPARGLVVRRERHHDPHGPADRQRPAERPGRAVEDVPPPVDRGTLPRARRDRDRGHGRGSPCLVRPGKAVAGTDFAPGGRETGRRDAADRQRRPALETVPRRRARRRVRRDGITRPAHPGRGDRPRRQSPPHRPDQSDALLLEKRKP
ncbi:hypothetical protein G3I59_09765 [Amycolatopsis rubida]|uniref:Uncharacterized protein n=1 Tax=Amycolatopsis rubida TaxID=112413 RepID=A0ABX0BN99_9PSEU|nr:hypothetical protein [Amycolatopsis rubida]NEC55865.1 hypothetical protein [Amycolatopsis rubida]